MLEQPWIQVVMKLKLKKWQLDLPLCTMRGEHGKKTHHHQCSTVLHSDRGMYKYTQVGDAEISPKPYSRVFQWGKFVDETKHHSLPERALTTVLGEG